MGGPGEGGPGGPGGPRGPGILLDPRRGGTNAPGGGPPIIPGPGPIPNGGEPGPIPEYIGGGPPMMPGLGGPPIPPPMGGSDCTLSCKLAFRAGKNVPSFCMRTMGGSDACDRGSDGLGINPPGRMGPSRCWFPIGAEGGRKGPSIGCFPVAAAKGPLYGGGIGGGA